MREMVRPTLEGRAESSSKCLCRVDIASIMQACQSVLTRTFMAPKPS
jgi:hypothetical protein